MTIKKYQRFLKVSFLFVALNFALDTYAAAAAVEEVQWNRFLTAMRQRVTPPDFYGGAKGLEERMRWEETKQTRIALATRAGIDLYKREKNIDYAIVKSLLSLAVQEESCLGSFTRFFAPFPSEKDLIVYVEDGVGLITLGIIKTTRLANTSSSILIKWGIETSFEGLLTDIVNDLA